MSRSYSRDIFGRTALTGLTYAETHEFELLDAEPPVDERGDLLAWETDDKSFPPSQSRWLELYQFQSRNCQSFLCWVRRDEPHAQRSLVELPTGGTFGKPTTTPFL